MDLAIADRAGELSRQHRDSHSPIDHVDTIVAATADMLGAQMWTRNLKHFPMFEGLQAPY